MAAACALVSSSVELAAQIATSQAPFVVANAVPGVTAGTLRSTNGNVIILSTNRLGSIRGRTYQVPQQQTNLKNSPGAPAPGVYKTEPYTCIVIVPGASPDDKSVIHPAEPAPNMPVLTPDLRFVPLHPK